MPAGDRLLQVHFPDSQAKLKAARERLAFDEIFFLQMGVLRQKRDWKQVKDDASAWRRLAGGAAEDAALRTDSRAAARTDRDPGDLNSGLPMNRLLQGDVGSGKDRGRGIHAAMIAAGGAQAAVMAQRHPR